MRLSIRPLSAAVVTALTAVSLIVPSGAASAETVRTDDAAGDVWEVLLEGDRERPGWVPAGSVVNTDVVATEVMHRPRRITFTTTFVDLARSQNLLMMSHRMRFDDGPVRTLQIFRFDRPRTQSQLTGPRGRPVRCGGLTHQIAYASDTISASFPRRCVGDPESFTFASVVTSYHGWETRRSADDRIYYENALGAGHSYRDFSEPVERG